MTQAVTEHNEVVQKQFSAEFYQNTFGNSILYSYYKFR